MSVPGRSSTTSTQKMVIGALTLGGAAAIGTIFLPTPAAPVPIVLFGIGGWMFVRGLVSHLGRAAFRLATMTLVPPDVPMAGRSRVRITLDPKRALKISAGVVRLVSEERAVYRAGTNTRRYREEIYQEVFPLRLPETLSTLHMAEVVVQLPGELPATFHGMNNSLRTYLSLEVAIDGWPDLHVEEELLVRPELARA